jgi:hypothetical protein
MSPTAGRLARKGLFTAVSVLALGAALVPDWATALKAQYYGANVDLSLQATPSANIATPGGDIDMLLTAHDAGPGDAVRPRVLAYWDGGFTPVGTSGCSNDAEGFPLCYLAAPLLAGGSADYLVHGHIDPTARGEMQFVATLMSDDTETQPGDEVVLLRLPLQARVDLGTTVACTPARVRLGETAHCQVRFRNPGPSAAASPFLQVTWSDGEASTFDCSASQEPLCGFSVYNFGADARPAWQMPGSEAVLQIDLPVTYPPAWNETLTVSASAQQLYTDLETDSSDNSASAHVVVPLFFDGFDDAQP